MKENIKVTKKRLDIAEKITSNDIENLLKKSAEYYRVSQEYQIEIHERHGHQYLCVAWWNCLLEENATLQDGFYIGERIDSWWYLKNDGTWIDSLLDME